jgi:outer membrane protein assembly factor BamB
VSPTAVIDLDRADAGDPAGRPAWSGRPSVRWLAVTAALVGVLLTASGAQRFTPLTPWEVLPGDGVADILGSGRDILLLRHPDSTRTLVESYRIPGGARRWSAPVDAGSEFVGIGAGRVVLVASGQPSALTALDVVSGQQAWTRTGYVPSIYGMTGSDRVVLAEQLEPATDARPEPQRRNQRLVGIDAATGDIRWSVDPPAGSARSYEPVDDGDATGSVEVAELDPDGGLRLRDAESGAIVRTASIDNPGPVDAFDIAGDRLLAYRSDPRLPGEPGPIEASVFDLTTGSRLWQRTGEPDTIPPWWCGHLLCAGGGAIAVLDPDTGRELWHLDGWTDLQPLRGNRLLATRTAPDGQRIPDGLVLDAATGQTIRRIVGWDVVSESPLPGTILLASRRSGGTSQVARLDVGTGRVTMIGWAEHRPAPLHCMTTTKILACHNGVVSVWRLPG